MAQESFEKWYKREREKLDRRQTRIILGAGIVLILFIIALILKNETSLFK